MVRDMEHFAIDIRSYRVPLERAVRQIMMPSITENFNTSGRPVPWAPLSDATWEKRAQDGWSGGDILIKSGTLRSVAGSFKIWKIGTGGAAVTGLPGAEYGGYHQAGYGTQPESLGSIAARTGQSLADVLRGITEAQRGAMASGTTIGSGWRPWAPARPFILFQDQDIAGIQRIFADWLGERALRVGKFIPVG
jgi:phage gpG-like protein